MVDWAGNPPISGAHPTILVDIATAKAVRTQRLKSPLGMQSPPARTNKKNVLMDLAMAITVGLPDL